MSGPAYSPLDSTEGSPKALQIFDISGNYGAEYKLKQSGEKVLLWKQI